MPISLSNHGFDAWTYIQALLLTICGGGEAIAETREVRNDAALRELFQLKSVPSESAIGDWLRRMGIRGGAASMKMINKEMLHKILSQAHIRARAKINLVF